jgi:hypothetical protein
MALGNLGKYSQLLQNMPNPNTGTHVGGLSHVLQQALLGYSAGQDQRADEAKRTRLADALRIGMGTPGNPITDAPGAFANAFAAGDGGPPPMSMDPARQPVAGDRQGMMAALGDFPELQLKMINEDMSAAAAAEAAEALYDRTRADELFDTEAANVYDTEAARLALEGKMSLAEIKAAGGGGGDLGSYDTYLDPVNGPVTMRAGEAAALGFVKYDAPGDPPSADYVNFLNPATQEMRTVNANDANAVQALMSQGFVMAGVASANSTPAKPYTDAGKAKEDFNNGFITPEEYEQVRIDAEGLGLSEDAFANADKLRDELNALSKDYLSVRDAYSRIGAAAQDPSPAGDLALIFNYMKILDPGSVVRESEFAQAAATGSYGEQIQAAVQRIGTGERLTEVQRKDFVDRARRLFESQAGNYQANAAAYTSLATAFGIDPSLVVVDYSYVDPTLSDPLGIR